MVHTHAKNQGQRSVRSKDRVEKNGLDTINCITFPADALGKIQLPRKA